MLLCIILKSRGSKAASTSALNCLPSSVSSRSFNWPCTSSNVAHILLRYLLQSDGYLHLVTLFFVTFHKSLCPTQSGDHHCSPGKQRCFAVLQRHLESSNGMNRVLLNLSTTWNGTHHFQGKCVPSIILNFDNQYPVQTPSVLIELDFVERERRKSQKKLASLQAVFG